MAVITNANLNTGLTDYARGLKYMGHVAEDIFTRVTAPTLVGSYWDFGSGDFDLEEESGPVSLDQPYPRVEWDAGTGVFKIANRGLEAVVTDIERDQAAGALALPRKKVRRMTRWLKTRKEIVARDLLYATGASAYPASHKLDQTAAKWDNDTVDPGKVVFTAQRLIRQAIGVRGNAILIPDDVLAALQGNKIMRERFQFVKQAEITPADIAMQFGIPSENIFIGEAIYNSAARGKTRKLSDIWSAHCVVFYKERMPEGMPPEDAGFAAEFRLEGYEDVKINQTRQANPPGDCYVTQDPYGLQVQDYSAGVLLQNCI